MAAAVRVGVPKESAKNEKRVAATPDSVKKLLAQGFTITIERGAGLGSGIEDAAYESAGATLYLAHRKVVRDATIVFENVRESGAAMAYDRPLIPSDATDTTLIEPNP